MEKDKQETVTLSLQTYEEMKEELKELKKLVQEKVIYRDVIPSVYGYVLMGLFTVLLFLIIIN
jgi:hypothetical protein